MYANKTFDLICECWRLPVTQRAIPAKMCVLRSIDDIDLRGMKIWSRYEEFVGLRSVDR